MLSKKLSLKNYSNIINKVLRYLLTFSSSFSKSRSPPTENSVDFTSIGGDCDSLERLLSCLSGCCCCCCWLLRRADSTNSSLWSRFLKSLSIVYTPGLFENLSCLSCNSSPDGRCDSDDVGLLDGASLVALNGQEELDCCCCVGPSSPPPFVAVSLANSSLEMDATREYDTPLPPPAMPAITGDIVIAVIVVLSWWCVSWWWWWTWWLWWWLGSSGGSFFTFWVEKYLRRVLIIDNTLNTDMNSQNISCSSLIILSLSLRCCFIADFR